MPPSRMPIATKASGRRRRVMSALVMHAILRSVYCWNMTAVALVPSLRAAFTHRCGGGHLVAGLWAAELDFRAFTPDTRLVTRGMRKTARRAGCCDAAPQPTSDWIR